MPFRCDQASGNQRSEASRHSSDSLGKGLLQHAARISKVGGDAPEVRHGDHRSDGARRRDADRRRRSARHGARPPHPHGGCGKHHAAERRRAGQRRRVLGAAGGPGRGSGRGPGRGSGCGSGRGPDDAQRGCAPGTAPGGGPARIYAEGRWAAAASPAARVCAPAALRARTPPPRGAHGVPPQAAREVRVRRETGACRSARAEGGSRTDGAAGARRSSRCHRRDRRARDEG
ncbi:hypothetical protein ABH935_004298 [Catenulispora sp. GAS73]